MATFNRAKVANATGTATAGTLTLGATSPGYSDLSKYNTRNDVPYLITWDGGYERLSRCASTEETTPSKEFCHVRKIQLHR